MADNASGSVAETKRRSWPVDFMTRLVTEKPLGVVGLVITLVLLFTGIFADFLAPYGVNEVHVGLQTQAPSAKYWLGTDNLGRDILSRVIFGARVSVIVGLTGASVSTLIALFIGLLSGYIGGTLDLIVQRFVDAVMCLPGLILLIAVIATIGQNMWSLIFTLGVVWGIGGSRIIRSAVIGVKENMYVTATIAVGCPTSRILTRHILPNIVASAIILFSIHVPALILTEASLSFLGYGIPPPQPSWGSMLGLMGRTYMFKAPWMVIWPGLALAIVVYGINMFGDTVRDILDPRLRGGLGRYGLERKKKLRKKSIDKANKKGTMDRRR